MNATTQALSGWAGVSGFWLDLFLIYCSAFVTRMARPYRITDDERMARRERLRRCMADPDIKKRTASATGATLRRLNSDPKFSERRAALRPQSAPRTPRGAGV